MTVGERQHKQGKPRTEHEPFTDDPLDVRHQCYPLTPSTTSVSLSVQVLKVTGEPEPGSLENKPTPHRQPSALEETRTSDLPSGIQHFQPNVIALVPKVGGRALQRALEQQYFRLTEFLLFSFIVKSTMKKLH